ncbi:ScbR family autoregulator-binding transcription factor [Streptomyces sp. CSDS2]|uniref:ScbR family autoregulator-binding transcription factor n=1 Tax=Streptomyces sp. CSDS2 TaxID=3055051 RepID=UPI0025B04142|nr:ScbR family autoregulator-binding transcription factor [Streptomyces sp. CSDS2]MDN3263000.1 ScbR family autoregulator-binding transcription factor [Streptomyces sp. CSDS2]
MAQQERALQTRRQLVEAAASVFAERGYDGASTGEILTRAGFTRGAMYHHFASKEAIAQEVVAAQIEALRPPTTSVRLQAAIDITLTYARLLQTSDVLRAAVRLTVEETSFSQSRTAPYQWALDVVENVLREADAGGELLPGTPIPDLAQLIVGSFTGIQLLSNLVSGRDDLLHRVSLMWDLLLPGIAVPGVLRRLDTHEERGHLLGGTQGDADAV